MIVNGKDLNLKEYMELENKEDKRSPLYNETFYNIVLNYLGCMGEFLEEDIKFINDNDYTIEDFINEY